MFRVLLLFHTNTLKIRKRKKSSFTTFLYVNCIGVEDISYVCVLDLKFIFLQYVGVEFILVERLAKHNTA